MGNWYFNFEIGQAAWDYAQIGIGTDTGSLNWAVANYYEDGGSPNKRVRRDLSGYQFTATGSHWVFCQAKEGSGDTYTTVAELNLWAQTTAYPPAGTWSYFTCNAISVPTSCTATKDGTNGDYEIDLAFTYDGTHYVMIVAREGADMTGNPTNGTPYALGAACGDGTVIYNGVGTGTPQAHNKDNAYLIVKPTTTYYYRFYSENNSYYSSPASANATTDPPAVPTNCTTTIVDPTRIDLSWTKASPGNFNVMVVARRDTDLTADPVDDTSYIAGDSIGGGKVIYNGAGTSYSHTSLVSNGCTYYYRLYSEAWSNYSTKVEKSTATDTTKASNLYPNPGFELGDGTPYTDAYYWEQWGDSSRKYNTDWGWTGIIGDYMYGFNGWVGADADGGCYQNIHVTPGDIYKFSVDASKEATFAATSFTLYLEFYDENDTKLDAYTQSNSILGAVPLRDSWTTFSVDGMAPANALYCRPVANMLDMTAGGALCIDQTSLSTFTMTPAWVSPDGAPTVASGYTLNYRPQIWFTVSYFDTDDLTDVQIVFSTNSNFATASSTYQYTVSATGWDLASPFEGGTVSTYTPQTDLFFPDSPDDSDDTTTHYMRIRSSGTNCWGNWSDTRKFVVKSSWTWTDSNLTADSTAVRAVHLTELMTAIDNVRQFRGLSAGSWTDSSITADVTEVRKVHMDELRSNLATALDIVGASYSWTDPTITSDVTAIKADHFTEIRSSSTVP